MLKFFICLGFLFIVLVFFRNLIFFGEPTLFLMYNITLEYTTKVLEFLLTDSELTTCSVPYKEFNEGVIRGVVAFKLISLGL